MKYSKEKLNSSYSKSDFVFFWKHTPAKSGEITQTCLSQWWKCSFEEDGVIQTIKNLVERSCVL